MAFACFIQSRIVKGVPCGLAILTSLDEIQGEHWISRFYLYVDLIILATPIKIYYYFLIHSNRCFKIKTYKYQMQCW